MGREHGDMPDDPSLSQPAIQEYALLERAARDQRAIDEGREDLAEVERLAAEGHERRVCASCGDFYAFDLIAARPLFADRCPPCRALSCLACGEVAEDEMELAPDRVGCETCGAERREDGAA